MDQEEDDKPIIGWQLLNLQPPVCFCDGCNSLTCGVSFHDREILKLAPAEIYTEMAERAWELLGLYMQSETAKQYGPPAYYDIVHTCYIERRRIILKMRFLVERDPLTDFCGGWQITPTVNYEDALWTLAAQLRANWN